MPAAVHRLLHGGSLRELPDPVSDPEQVRRIADDILADPRYQPPTESPWEVFLGWVGDRIADLLGRLGGSGGGAVLAWVLLAGIVAAIVLVVLRFGPGVRIERTDRPGAAPSMVELARSPAEWRAEAARLEAAGRFREAMRCQHRALVADLVAAGAIPEIPGRTAREYVADVTMARPPSGPSMAAATDLFEAAWYGDAPTGPPELARFVELEHEVLRAEPTPAGAR
jgi:hypothetical protein